VNRLVIFDVDGTLTNPSAVDDECDRDAVASVLSVAPEAIDWSGTPHFTDLGILRWLWSAHRGTEPTLADVARMRSEFVHRLGERLHAAPSRFSTIAGAVEAVGFVRAQGWRVAIATGGWGPSARLKLDNARLDVDDSLLSCSDDAYSREEIVQIARRRAEVVHGCSFDRVVSVGDGVWDVTTATALKLPFVGIAAGERAERLRAAGAATVLSDFSDLAAVVRALDTAVSPATA
jgi:phosphoglycolate phosphatase-like HAD superfamily hydrolase